MEFERAGQKIVFGAVPERTVFGFERSKRNFHHILNKLCTTELPASEIDKVYLHAPEMIVNALEMGRLKNVLLNLMGMFSLPPGEYKDRDEKTVCQQGPTQITHVKPMERFKAWGVCAQLAVTEKENEAVSKGKAAKKKNALNQLDKQAALASKKLATEAEKERVKGHPKEEQRYCSMKKRQQLSSRKMLVMLRRWQSKRH